MSCVHSWESFKVPRLLHILKWMSRWQDPPSSDSARCLYSQILSSAGQGPSQDKTMLLCCGVFLDQACKILDWQACRLSKQSLSFVLSVWYPVSCHDHYTLTQKERFHKLARERHDQRSRKKEFGKARWEQESSWNSLQGCINNTWHFWNHVGSGPNRPKGPVCILNSRIHEKPKTCQRSGSFFQ